MQTTVDELDFLLLGSQLSQHFVEKFLHKDLLCGQIHLPPTLEEKQIATIATKIKTQLTRMSKVKFKINSTDTAQENLFNWLTEPGLNVIIQAKYPETLHSYQIDHYLHDQLARMSEFHVSVEDVEAAQTEIYRYIFMQTEKWTREIQNVKLLQNGYFMKLKKLTSFLQLERLYTNTRQQLTLASLRNSETSAAQGQKNFFQTQFNSVFSKSFLTSPESFIHKSHSGTDFASPPNQPSSPQQQKSDIVHHQDEKEDSSEESDPEEDKQTNSFALLLDENGNKIQKKDLVAFVMSVYAYQQETIQEIDLISSLLDSGEVQEEEFTEGCPFIFELSQAIKTFNGKYSVKMRKTIDSIVAAFIEDFDLPKEVKFVEEAQERIKSKAEEKEFIEKRKLLLEQLSADNIKDKVDKILSEDFATASTLVKELTPFLKWVLKTFIAEGGFGNADDG